MVGVSSKNFTLCSERTSKHEFLPKSQTGDQDSQVTFRCVSLIHTHARTHIHIHTHAHRAHTGPRWVLRHGDGARCHGDVFVTALLVLLQRWR